MQSSEYFINAQGAVNLNFCDLQAHFLRSKFVPHLNPCLLCTSSHNAAFPTGSGYHRLYYTKSDLRRLPHYIIYIMPLCHTLIPFFSFFFSFYIYDLFTAAAIDVCQKTNVFGLASDVALETAMSICVSVSPDWNSSVTMIKGHSPAKQIRLVSNRP